MQTRLTAEEAHTLACQYYDATLDTVLDIIKHKAQQGLTKTTFELYIDQKVLSNLHDLGYVAYTNQDGNVEVLW